MYCSAELGPVAADNTADGSGSRSALAELAASDLSLEEFAAQAMAAVAVEEVERRRDEPPVDGSTSGDALTSPAKGRRESERLPDEGSEGASQPAGSWDDFDLEAELGRGRGPFGPRDASMRLMLVPSSSYGAGGDKLRARLAQLLSVDLYTAGAHLRRSWPSFLDAPDDPDRGLVLLDALEEAGFRVLCVQGREWVAQHLPLSVTAMNSEGAPGAWRFLSEDGEAHDVRSEDLSWAALGEITEDGQERPSSQERNRWGVAPRPASGVLDRSSGSYVLLDLCRHSSTRPLRIRTDQFDFSCLGTGRSLAAAVNLKSLLEMLRPPSGPPLTVDTAFRRLPRLPPRPGLVAQAGNRARMLSREAEFSEYVSLINMVQHGID